MKIEVIPSVIEPERSKLDNRFYFWKFQINQIIFTDKEKNQPNIYEKMLFEAFKLIHKPEYDFTQIQVALVKILVLLDFLNLFTCTVETKLHQNQNF